MRVLSALVALFACVEAAKGVFEATDANFKKAVLEGEKNSFVKFLAPWWGHCKAMKADWDKLGGKYANSDTVQIVDVDCTADNAKNTCAQQQVKGYPTIKYFMAGSGRGKPYQQGRDLAALDRFVKSTLDIAQCDPVTGKACKANQLKFIEAQKGKNKAQLQEETETRTAAFKALKAEHKEAGKAWRAKEREFKKKEKLYKKAAAILKVLEANAPEGEADAGEAPEHGEL